MKVRKVHPDQIWSERREDFEKLTPEQRLEWLQRMQDRMRSKLDPKAPLKVKVILRGELIK